MKHLTASDIYAHFRPSRCDERHRLVASKVEPAPPSAFALRVMAAGRDHERAHLVTLPDVTDLSGGSIDERARQTVTAIRERRRCLYQPVLVGDLTFDGESITLRGVPDFLLLADDGESYRVRDVKLATNLKRHDEIPWQLRFYGYLLDGTDDGRAAELEVIDGKGACQPIADVPEEELIGLLARIVRAINLDGSEPPIVGWTKCSQCGFRQRCWSAAESRRDVALLAKTSQGVVTALRAEGVASVDELVDQFDEAALAQVVIPHGARTRPIGVNQATTVLRHARGFADAREIIFGAPQVPDASGWVMFDLEGIQEQLAPPGTPEVFLWGMQAFDDSGAVGDFEAAVAPFTTDGDEQGWNDFLDRAERLLTVDADIPFVHWNHYEKTKIEVYVKRLGDRDGIAQRVLDNLLDLLRVVERCVALPIPSYSLKLVEKYVGFERSAQDYGGDWAMERYIAAGVASSAPERDEIMREILRYNQEDLEATWAVLCWLRQLSG